MRPKLESFHVGFLVIISAFLPSIEMSYTSSMLFVKNLQLLHGQFLKVYGQNFWMNIYGYLEIEIFNRLTILRIILF